MKITPKLILTIIHSLKGSGAQKRVKEIYNDFASKHGKSKTKSNHAWCSETVSAGFIKANATNLIGGIALWSPDHKRHFKQLGIWKSGHDRIPNVGDIAIFQDKHGNPNHSEMVFSVNKSKGTFVALSGNYLGGIGFRTRKIHASNIHGYGCPKYNSYNTVTPTIVMNVLKGKYGKGAKIGTTRYDQLAMSGYDPDAVQAKINWVVNTAQDIKNGKSNYGNNDERRQKLGIWYDVVQKQINVLYGIDKW